MFVARPIGEMVNTLPSQGNIHGFEFHTGHQDFVILTGLDCSVLLYKKIR